MAALASWIFWLYLFSEGGSGDAAAIFCFINWQYMSTQLQWRYIDHLKQLYTFLTGILNQMFFLNYIIFSQPTSVASNFLSKISATTSFMFLLMLKEWPSCALGSSSAVLLQNAFACFSFGINHPDWLSLVFMCSHSTCIKTLCSLTSCPLLSLYSKSITIRLQLWSTVVYSTDGLIFKQQSHSNETDTCVSASTNKEIRYNSHLMTSFYPYMHI